MVDTKMVKSVGEHWVCAELARRGWAPALTRDGLSRTDILAVGVDRPGRPQLEVQVKAATRVAATSWPLGRSIHEFAQSPREWFVLVIVPQPGEQPDAYVVPRDHVAAAAYISHRDWLTDPSVPAGKRNAPLARSRVLASHLAGYRNCWGLLGNLTSEVPVMLPAAWRTLATSERVGLPDGHPWQAQMPEWADVGADDFAPGASHRQAG